MVSFSKVVFFLAHMGSSVATRRSVEQKTVGASGPRIAEAMKMVESLREAKAQGSDITALVDSMLTMVRDDIIGKIKIDHNSTQDELNSKKDAAVDATNDAGAEKTAADGLFGAMNECVSTEKIELQEHEVEVTETAAAIAARDTAKNDATIAASITYTLPESTFTCNALTDVNCANSEAAFHAAVDADRTAWENDWQSKQDNFDSKNQTWTTKESELATQQGEELAAHNDYQTQRQTCDTATMSKGTAVCVYAEKEETACTKQSEYATLVGQVEGSGTVWSNQDRETEFSTSALVECLLNQLKDETQNCDGPFPMDAEVTALSYTQPSNTYTACVQSGIIFKDTEWNRPTLLPDGSFPDSTAYTEVNTVAVTLTNLVDECEGEDDKED